MLNGLFISPQAVAVAAGVGAAAGCTSTIAIEALAGNCEDVLCMDLHNFS
ncbi:MAG: hypothetical protein J6P82_09345 [Bacteroidales bacterium]|nr:hypothetical protein [Bacteroidales bacterium]MBP5214058.1 hypothetical protein [Bacteroidales bacterium]